MAKYPIIPDSNYFDTTSTNLATPERFNAIFNTINDRAVSELGFIRPVNIASDYIGVSVDSTGDPSIDTITFYELGSAISPLNSGGTSLYDISYAWTKTGSAGTISGSSTGDSVIIDLSGGTVDPTSDNLQVSLTITYEDASSSTIYTDTVSYGVPFIRQGTEGQAAITTPVPLIYAPFNHQPIDLTKGYAEIDVLNVSMVPPDWGSYNVNWSLTDSNGSNVLNFIHTSSNTGATLRITDDNKKYILTMTIDDGGTEYNTQVELFTYKNGVLFLNWEADRVPQDPEFVEVTGKTAVHPATNFPIPNGSIEVKWGRDSSDFGVCYFAGHGSAWDPNGTAVSAALTEVYGSVPVEDLNTYGLLNIFAGVQPVGSWNYEGQYLFIENMTTPVEIVAKVTNIDFNNMIPMFTNSIPTYLVKGLPLQGGFHGSYSDNVSIGPGAERNYIQLKYYEPSTDTGQYVYTGIHDQYMTVVPSLQTHPVSAIFKDVPIGGKFHAKVITSIGSVYSSGKESETIGSASTSTARAISNIAVEGQQFGIIATINLDSNITDNPVGYLLSVREYNTGALVDEDSNASFSPDSVEFDVFYSNSAKVNIPGTLGKKMKVWAKAVMADGSMSEPVSAASTVVEFPAALDQSLLTKHLGRFTSALPGATAEWESTWESDTPSEYMFTTHYSSFSKNIFLQGVKVWVHDLGDGNDTVDIVINLGGDEHTDIAVALGPNDYDHEEPIPLLEKDLGKIVSAGDPISINIRNNNGISLGDLGGEGIDLSAELVFAYNYDTSSNSSTSSGGGAA